MTVDADDEAGPVGWDQYKAYLRRRFEAERVACVVESHRDAPKDVQYALCIPWDSRHVDYENLQKVAQEGWEAFRNAMSPPQQYTTETVDERGVRDYTFTPVPLSDVVAPPRHRHNYVGRGTNYVWPCRDRFSDERSFGLALRQLGYTIGIAEKDFSLLSVSSLSVVRQFQCDYNIAAVAQPVDANPYPARLATDSLIGAQTICALLNAERWIATANITWFELSRSSRAEMIREIRKHFRRFPPSGEW